MGTASVITTTLIAFVCIVLFVRIGSKLKRTISVLSYNASVRRDRNNLSVYNKDGLMQSSQSTKLEKLFLFPQSQRSGKNGVFWNIGTGWNTYFYTADCNWNATFEEIGRTLFLGMSISYQFDSWFLRDAFVSFCLVENPNLVQSLRGGGMVNICSHLTLYYSRLDVCYPNHKNLYADPKYREMQFIYLNHADVNGISGDITNCFIFFDAADCFYEMKRKRLTKSYCANSHNQSVRFYVLQEDENENEIALVEFSKGDQKIAHQPIKLLRVNDLFAINIEQFNVEYAHEIKEFRDRLNWLRRNLFTE